MRAATQGYAPQRVTCDRARSQRPVQATSGPARQCPALEIRRKSRGAALVESALISLVFIVTLLGAIDIMQFLFFHQAMRERVRAGARYAVTHTYDPEVLRNFVLWNSPERRDDPGLFGLSPEMVAVERHGEGTEADRIEVRIENFPVRLFTPWLAGRVLHPVFRSVEPVESLGATD
jgi:hypothetical protein